MMLSYCVIVPVYNHGRQLARTLVRLDRYELPIFVVDDGSRLDERVLIEEATGNAGARLVRLPNNGGKGAAVMAGMRAAHAAGFTHAIQVDADGQHDLDDVPRMVELSRQSPVATVVGIPVYDASAPKSRLYGRRITNFWVRMETWSRGIPDAMCGFRAYPLAEAVRLIDSLSFNRRMGFDIEILVRLYWRGVPMVHMPTSVLYPEGNLSNFNLLKDNLQISLTHARLVFGMLARLPFLIARETGLWR